MALTVTPPRRMLNASTEGGGIMESHVIVLIAGIARI
jgi:hypothetical protein